MNLKPHFSRFLAADPGRLHFAAHSHHFWPDVAFRAQRQCWEDAARLADRKWERIFGEVIPAAQRHAARLLNLPDPRTIAFAPNTHEFLMRILSLFPASRAVRVLTTDSEFHSFTRQMRRLQEDGLAKVTRVPAEPFADLAERLAAAARRGEHDLVYVSQVFFNSGFAIADLGALAAAIPRPETVVVIDGYHGFMALPTDLAPIAGRAFYLAGGYKYAMAGEGVCFLHAPPRIGARPRDTGWFAGFGALEAAADGGPVGYTADGSRFLGSTFDPVGLYRLVAVMGWLAGLGVTVADIHAHAHALQRRFVEGLEAIGRPALHPSQLIVPLEESARGNFLTFRTAEAGALHRRLLEADVVTDHRGDRLRFGFGIYHDEGDVDSLLGILRRLLD